MGNWECVFASFKWIVLSLVIASLFVVRVRLLKPSGAAVISRVGKFILVDKSPFYVYFPLIDTVKEFSVALNIYDVPAFQLVTKENLSIYVDLIVHFYVTDGKKFAFASSNSLDIVKQTLCHILGTHCRNFSTDDVRIRLPQVIEQTTQDLNNEVAKVGVTVSALKVENVRFPKSVEDSARILIEEEAKNRLTKYKLEFQQQESQLRLELQLQTKKAELEIVKLEQDALRKRVLEESETQALAESARNTKLIDNVAYMVEKLNGSIPPEDCARLLMNHSSNSQQIKALTAINSNNKASVIYLPTSQLLTTQLPSVQDTSIVDIKAIGKCEHPDFTVLCHARKLTVATDGGRDGGVVWEA